MRVQRTVIIIVTMFVFVAEYGHAQQPTQPSSAPNQPVELPQIIIEGAAAVDVPGGSKEAPSRPPRLTAAMLDTINPLQKSPLPSLTSQAWPQYQYQDAWVPGWLEARIGNYITPIVYGGYSLHADRYLIDLVGGFEASTGWQPGAEYTKAHVGLMSTYLAPEKFILFGGSVTTASVTADHRNYGLYALTNSPRRSTQLISATVHNQGMVDSVAFEGTLNWSTRALATADQHRTASILHGQARVWTPWSDGRVSAEADLSVRSFGDRSYPWISVMASYDMPWIGGTASVRIGPQWFESTSGDSRFGLGIDGELRLPVSPEFSVYGSIRSGLQNRQHEELLAENPYLSDTARIDASYDLARIRAGVEWHPTMTVGATLSIEAGRTERTPVWVNAGGGLFDLSYLQATTIRLAGDARWVFSSTDALTIDGRFTMATIDDYAQQPYVPLAEVSVGYDHQWTTAFKTNLALVYVGDRWADLEHTRQLAGFIDVKLDASYTLSSILDVTLQGRNLVGSTMFLWEGYRERSFFLSAGILWRM
ncbi:MAG: hypothetical protein ACO3I4_04650 [Candidatus Kapaibacteriota bacterium]